MLPGFDDLPLRREFKKVMPMLALALQTGVAVDAASIHAALVALNLITA
jgi:hypothetical protein